jgi:hypothetical protein
VIAMANTPSLNISRRPISLSSAWLDIGGLLLLHHSNPIRTIRQTRPGGLFAHRAVFSTSNLER